jgi:hypothetical protein
MSPNPFNLIKLALSPHRWGPKRSSSTQSVAAKEEWNTPVPGTYEYKPGRGWYLIEYAENVDNASISDAGTASTAKAERLPRQVTYCKLLHRMMFTTEYNERRRFQYIKKDNSKRVQHIGFFRLDDDVTWVQCWDEFGNFIEGPYQRWCFDAETQRMRPMQYRDAVIESEERESRRDSWERMQRQSVGDVISGRCSVCSSRSIASFRRPAYEARTSASTAAASSRSHGTSLTTPSSGILSNQNTADELDPKELHAELLKLHIT